MSDLLPLDEGLKQLAAKVWYWPVLRGAFAVVFGVVMLIWPGPTAVVLITLLGAFVLIDGLVGIVEAIRYRDSGGLALRVAVGVLGVLVGLMMLISPVQFGKALVWVIGLWAIVAGLVQTVVAVASRRTRSAGWGWALAAALATLVFGVVVMVDVGVGALAILLLIAWYAILVGLLLVALGLTVRAAGRRL